MNKSCAQTRHFLRFWAINFYLKAVKIGSEHDLKTRTDVVSILHTLLWTLFAKEQSEKFPSYRDEHVEVGVRWVVDDQILFANVIKRFVIKQQGNISMVQQPMSWKKSVVGFNDAGRGVWRRVDFESNFGFFSALDGNFQRTQSKNRDFYLIFFDKLGSKKATIWIFFQKTLLEIPVNWEKELIRHELFNYRKKNILHSSCSDI